MKIKTTICIAIIAAAMFASSHAMAAGCAPAKREPAKPKLEWQSGMCYTTWTKDRYNTQASDDSLKVMAKAGTKWVSILTTWYQDRCHTTKIFPTDKTPTDESVIRAINTAHSLGMKVMVKPHLDLLDLSSGSWRGEIACISEPDWKAWFESYRDFMLHYAKLCQENKVEMLCIGTELTTVAMIREDMWKEIVIKPVREVYKGLLTYAANWNDEYNHIGFWDALDYVGIDAYYPLSDKEIPAYEELKEGWKQWVKELTEFQARVNKPIIFPEVGYYSAKGTAVKPWEESATGNVELALQADCYEALLETFWDIDWFYGVYWWRWGTNVNFGGPNNRGYSMQNKPAQEVISRWYHKAPSNKKEF